MRFSPEQRDCKRLIQLILDMAGGPEMYRRHGECESNCRHFFRQFKTRPGLCRSVIYGDHAKSAIAPGHLVDAVVNDRAAGGRRNAVAVR